MYGCISAIADIELLKSLLESLALKTLDSAKQRLVSIINQRIAALSLSNKNDITPPAELKSDNNIIDSLSSSSQNDSVAKRKEQPWNNNQDQDSPSTKKANTISDYKMQPSASFQPTASESKKSAIDLTDDTKQVVTESKPIVNSVWSSEDICMLNTPADGSCLFYALIVGSLLPLAADKAKFQERYIKLFNRNDYSESRLPSDINALLEYFEKRNFEKIYGFLAQKQLIAFFRENLVEYMQQEINSGNHAYHDTYVSSKTIEQELNEMKQFTTWGGDREYRAFGAYLGEMTVVPLEAKSRSILDRTIFGLQAFTREVIYVVHTPASAFGTVNNHYQLLLPRTLVETKEKKISALNSKNWQRVVNDDADI